MFSRNVKKASNGPKCTTIFLLYPKRKDSQTLKK